MYNEPLGLPKGTVRAIMSLLFIVATLVTAFVATETFKLLLPITTIIVGYYFGRRTFE